MDCEKIISFVITTFLYVSSGSLVTCFFIVDDPQATICLVGGVILYAVMFRTDRLNAFFDHMRDHGFAKGKDGKA